MIPREIHDKMSDMLTKFPILTLTGARQSGKTTLLREAFPDYRYVNLEQQSLREFAVNDVEAFLERYDDRVVFDEVQRVPSLFSELQVVVDSRSQRPGQFVLSGSQNFLLMRHLTQSLAGRAAIMHLLPLSYSELAAAGMKPSDNDQWAWRGGYPRLYDVDLQPSDYFPSYVRSYVERDVRDELGVVKLAQFRSFLIQCALRVGELVNFSQLASQCGVDAKTAAGWLSLLESSFIAFRLYPYHANYGRRLVKTPKLYFYDTGLAAYLMGIESPDDLSLSRYRGALFENAVVLEILKRYYALGKVPRLYFWRDAAKKDIDLVIEKGGRPHTVVEVKASRTFDIHAFQTIDAIAPLMDVDVARRVVVYGGTESFTTRHGRLMTVGEFGELVV